MPEDLIRYDQLIESALREVARRALVKVAKDGLPGEHHFYITFSTTYPGVVMPDYLRAQYQREMTIVLQFQFFGLKVEEDKFSVMLSFNNVREQLVVPFPSIVTFADPSVNFALQFASPADGESDVPPTDTPPDGDAPPKSEEKRGEVISLDMFRKK